MEFDKQLGAYTLGQYGDWKRLSNYITKDVIERIGMVFLVFPFFVQILLCFFTFHFLISYIFLLHSFCFEVDVEVA